MRWPYNGGIQAAPISAAMVVFGNDSADSNFCECLWLPMCVFKFGVGFAYPRKVGKNKKKKVPCGGGGGNKNDVALCGTNKLSYTLTVN